MAEPLSAERLAEIRAHLDYLAEGDGGLTMAAIHARDLLAEVKRLHEQIPQCNGTCLRASDVIEEPVGGNPVARAHRSCPLHGDPEQVAWELSAALTEAEAANERLREELGHEQRTATEDAILLERVQGQRRELQEKLRQARQRIEELERDRAGRPGWSDGRDLAIRLRNEGATDAEIRDAFLGLWGGVR